MLDFLADAEQNVRKLLDDHASWQESDAAACGVRTRALWRALEDGRKLILQRIEGPLSGIIPYQQYDGEIAMRILQGECEFFFSILDRKTSIFAKACRARVMTLPFTDFRFEIDHPDAFHAILPMGEPVHTMVVTDGSRLSNAFGNILLDFPPQSLTVEYQNKTSGIRKMLNEFRAFYPDRPPPSKL